MPKPANWTKEDDTFLRFMLVTGGSLSAARRSYRRVRVREDGTRTQTNQPIFYDDKTFQWVKNNRRRSLARSLERFRKARSTDKQGRRGLIEWIVVPQNYSVESIAWSNDQDLPTWTNALYHSQFNESNIGGEEDEDDDYEATTTMTSSRSRRSGSSQTPPRNIRGPNDDLSSRSHR